MGGAGDRGGWAECGAGVADVSLASVDGGLEFLEGGFDFLPGREGAVGDGVGVVEGVHGFFFFDGDQGFVDFAVGVLEAGEIEVPVGGEEFVHGLAFGGAVVVAFAREVDVLDLVLGVVVAVDGLDEGEFDFGGVGGPILAVGDDEHGTGGGEGGDFDVVGEVGGAAVDGFVAFAGAAAEHVGGDHDDGDGDGDAGIERGEEEGLGAAARAAGDGDAGGVGAGEVEEEIEGAHVGPGLGGEGEGAGVLALDGLVGGFAPAEEVERHGDAAHAGEHGAAGLDVVGETAAAVTVRAEDDGEGAVTLVGAIEGAGGPVAGDDFEADGLDGVAVEGAAVADDGVEGGASGEGVEVGAAQDLLFDVCGVGFPLVAVGGELEAAVEEGGALLGGEEAADAEGGAVVGDGGDAVGEGGVGGWGLGGGIGSEEGCGEESQGDEGGEA